MDRTLPQVEDWVDDQVSLNNDVPGPSLVPRLGYQLGVYLLLSSYTRGKKEEGRRRGEGDLRFRGDFL